MPYIGTGVQDPNYFASEPGSIELEGGNYTEDRLYNSSTATVTGDITLTNNLVLARITDKGNNVTLTSDGTTRTITGSGKIESGNIVTTLPGNFTGMTGTIGSDVVTTNITKLGTVTEGTLETGVGLNIECDAWRVTSNNAGATDPVVNWERVDDQHASNIKVGTGMVETSSNSGIFKFPSTGFWQVDVDISWYSDTGQGASNYIECYILLSEDSGSSYNDMARGRGALHGSLATDTTHASSLMKISNITTNYLKFKVDSGGTRIGVSDTNRTWFIVKKLGVI